MSTLGNIIDRFRHETRDFARVCSAEAVGDGVSLFFQIPDFPIVEGSLITRLQDEGSDPVAETNFTIDCESGQFALTGAWQTTPPSATQKLLWSWQWTRWSQAELIHLINAGIRFLGQEFEVEQENDALTTTSDVYEYAVPTGPVAAPPPKRITKVETRWSDDDRWRPSHNWYTKWNAGIPRIIFKFNPGDQQMRVTTVSRPIPFVEVEYTPETEPEGWPGLLEQTLASTGLPEEALEPLIWYTLWLAYEGRLTFRSRDDAAQHAKEESVVTMRDMEARASRIKTIFDLHYAQFQTEFINGRLVP